MQNNIIAINNLVLNIGSVTILHNISVCCDDKIAICGSNGSGKTSLLRCLYCYYRPSQGSITLNSQNIFTIPRMEYARKVAALPSQFNNYFDFRVHEVINMGNNLHQHALERNRDIALIEYRHRIKTYLDIDELWFANFNDLSSGEKQRVMLARTLWCCPEFLLLDEPTCHLDVRYRQNLISLLSSLNINMLIATHDEYVVNKVCNKLVLINQGSIESVVSSSMNMAVWTSTLAKGISLV